MKIIQLVTSRKSRGAEISAFLLSQELLKKGHQVYWVGLYPVDPAECLSLREGLDYDLEGDSFKFLDIKCLVRLRTLIKKLQPDIIQANGSDTWKYSVFALSGIPHTRLVYRNISMLSHWINNRFFVRKFYQILSNRVDYFCSVGLRANADLKRTLDLRDEICGVINRGIVTHQVSKEFGREYLKEYGIHKDDFVLVQVGSLSPEKNIDFSFSVIENLKVKIPNLKLLIVGDGPESERLVKRSKELEIGDSIFFTGYQKAFLSEILAGSNLLILTSLVEGVPGVVLEAGIQKTPSIGVDVGGVGEVILNNSTGVLVKFHSITEFSDQIFKLFNNDEELKHLGSNANSFISKEYSLVESVKKFENLYQDLLSTPK